MVLKIGRCDSCCSLQITMDSRFGGPTGPLPAAHSMNFLCLKGLKLSNLSPGSAGIGVPKEVVVEGYLPHVFVQTVHVQSKVTRVGRPLSLFKELICVYQLS